LRAFGGLLYVQGGAGERLAHLSVQQEVVLTLVLEDLVAFFRLVESEVVALLGLNDSDRRPWGALFI
jgi:hypothetical protein